MAWIEVHQGLREHKKLYACAELLNISRVEMLGTVISLWLWALDNAQNGSLEGISTRTIARVCDWPEKKAKVLVEALVSTGWLERNGDRLMIHDWMDYAGRLMERREKDRKRKRKSTDAPKDPDGIPAELPGSSDEIPVLPYLNRTLPYPTDISGGDGDRAGARAADAVDLAGVGLMPGEFPGVTVGHVAVVAQIAQGLAARSGRRCLEVDRRKVFEHVSLLDARTGLQAVSPDAVGLLSYAFDAAVLADRAGNWNYIDGIMARLRARGIETAEQARAWDEDRPDKEDTYGAV